MMEPLVRWDKRLSAKLHRDGPVVRRVCKILELSGHGIPWLAVTGGMLLWKPTPSWLNLLIGLMADLAMVGIAKVAVKRSRPCYNKDDMLMTVSVDRYSFPSGHTTRVAYVAAFAAHEGFLSTPMLACVVGWACTVATSRVVLGRHHVLDVVAGLLMGYSLFWAQSAFFWSSSVDIIARSDF